VGSELGQRAAAAAARRRRRRRAARARAGGRHYHPAMVAAAALLLLQLITTPTDQPKNSPCVTWVQASQAGAKNKSWDALDLYVPSIYSAWQWWHGGKTASGAPTGSCSPCSGKQGEFNCAYIFPCFSDQPGIQNWGHRDTSVGGVPRVSFLVTGCNTHLPTPNPKTGNYSAMGECHDAFLHCMAYNLMLFGDARKCIFCSILMSSCFSKRQFLAPR
jgi:hypothetical protein